MNEVTCHHLSSLRDSFFGCHLGLVRPHKAPHALWKFVPEVLGLDESHEIMSSMVSKLSMMGASSVNDFVAFEDQGVMLVGQV